MAYGVMRKMQQGRTQMKSSWSRAGWTLLVLMAVAAQGRSLPVTGTVAETMPGGGYTYLRVLNGRDSTWVAAPKSDVSVGSQVSIATGSFMKDFHSPSLNRTFDQILFTDRVVSDASGRGHPSTDIPPGHPPIDAVELPPGHPPIDAMDLPAGHPPIAEPDACCPTHGPSSAHTHGETGEVVETFSGGGYAYIHIKAKDQSVWAATARSSVAVGDRVVIPDGLLMRNFESPSLKRTFDTIYFVDQIQKAKP